MDCDQSSLLDCDDLYLWSSSGSDLLQIEPDSSVM